MSRAFIADTVAMILFFTTTGTVNEHLIAGMAWEQVWHARLLGGALMVPAGRPYGIWRDWIMQHARPDRISRLLWDSLALVSFQVPIYAVIIAVSGASGSGLLYGVLARLIQPGSSRLGGFSQNATDRRVDKRHLRRGGRR